MRKINRKNGAVLIISLIMLLLLTLIGATAIQTTALEEKMAGNLRNQNLAFQSAETALRVGEAYLNPTAPTFTDAGGNGCFYTVASLIPTASAILTAGFWTAYPACPSPHVPEGNPVNCNSVGSLNYCYIIQQVGSSPCSGGSLEGGNPQPLNVNLYRITARGTDTSNNAVVLLQTIYEKC
jgi:type IV pilus assembly protein PilX